CSRLITAASSWPGRSRAWTTARINHDTRGRGAKFPATGGHANRPGQSPLFGATLLVLEELLFDVLVDARQPFLGALRPIVVVADVALELLDPILGRAKLNRQLMCKLQGPLAIGVCRVGRLLKQGDDGLAGSVHRIAFVPRLPVGRKRDDLLGLDRAFAHRMSPPHDAVISYPCDSRRCRISLPDRK